MRFYGKLVTFIDKTKASNIKLNCVCGRATWFCMMFSIVYHRMSYYLP